MKPPLSQTSRIDSRKSIQNKKRKYSQDEFEQPEEQPDPLANATTLYVGNLYVDGQPDLYDDSCLLNSSSSFYTTEEQIHELFSKSASLDFPFRLR